MTHLLAADDLATIRKRCGRTLIEREDLALNETLDDVMRLLRHSDALTARLTALAAEHKRMRAALALFADEANWCDEQWAHPFIGVGLARRALREEAGHEPT